MRKLIVLLGRAPGIAIGDIVVLNLAFFIAFWLRFFPFLALHEANTRAYEHMLPLISFAALAILKSLGLYAKNWASENRSEIVYLVGVGVCGTAVATTALSYWIGEFALPRTVVVLSFFIQLLLLTLWRLLMKKLENRSTGLLRTLIVADDEMIGTRISKKFRCEDGYLVSAILPSESEELEILMTEVEVVVLAPNQRKRDSVLSLAIRHRKHVLVAPAATDFFLRGAVPQQFSDALMFSIAPPRLEAGQELVKRAFDLVVSVTMLLVCAPVMLAVYIFVPLESKGPALFRQERIGRGGTKFDLFKFRTMCADAESDSGPVLASEHDPRITPLGRFLRSTRLDELPQLINVLQGEMSMVGPRPEREFFVRQFEEHIPTYVLRLSVQPGISGMAQVMGRYSTSPERKLRFDLMYIFNYSLILDLKILLRTIWVVLRPEQSAGVALSVERLAIEVAPQALPSADSVRS
jgi:exopolysaccharide biosynthesis polyprenyl glycosylphosphotransferase